MFGIIHTEMLTYGNWTGIFIVFVMLCETEMQNVKLAYIANENNIYKIQRNDDSLV